MYFTKLTTVKIVEDLYKKVKVICLRDDFTLQKLVNRSMDLYVGDEKFKSKIDTYDNLQISGSQF